MPDNAFWSRVDQSGGPNSCWPWRGYCNPNGYGEWHPRVGEKFVASRFAFEDVNGVLPDEIEACHTCDNPPCCNPAHLFAGTHRENVADSIRKGRWALPPVYRGAEHPRAKATVEQVAEILALVDSGQLRRGGGRPRQGAQYTTIREVAERTGLAWATIQHIASGHTWKQEIGG